VSGDPYDLARFVDAQASTYERALAELRRGRKSSHWMWFVFPQLAGLGRSATAQHYGIRSLAEARAYLAHPLLGARFIDCATVVAGLDADPVRVLGSIDALKLHSSMTLFARADPAQPAFAAVLARHYGAQPDAATEDLLGRT
jgi:uncharacterized protein (DUF1810 family)